MAHDDQRSVSHVVARWLINIQSQVIYGAGIVQIASVPDVAGKRELGENTLVVPSSPITLRMGQCDE